jgi:hypothetical protein
MAKLHEDLYADIELSFGEAGCINFLGLRRMIKYFNEPKTYKLERNLTLNELEVFQS